MRQAFACFSPILDLCGLGLTELPSELRNLTHIRDLDVSNNKLTFLPDWLTGLSQLELLFAGDNLLSSMPETRVLPLSIKTLDLHANQLREVPDWIGELPRLERLDLAGNELSVLPGALTQMSSLSSLVLHGNSQLPIPPEMLAPVSRDGSPNRSVNPATILDYYFRVSTGLTRPLNEAKVILVGRGEVGKTSLVDRLVTGQFRSDSATTQGIKISHWPVQLTESEVVKLHIWDFGGQEIMHATHQFFLTERSLYIVVLNGRQGGEDIDAEYWLKLVSSFGGDSPVIIVLNKINSQPFDLNRRGLCEKYPGSIREFIRTDCKDGTGIVALREAIFRETDKLPNLRQPIPKSWMEVKNRLSGMEQNFLSFGEFRSLCKQLGESDSEAQDTLAVALHCLGIALNYKDDVRLRETHILNPHWVTQGIYSILNSRTVEVNRGELSVQELADILDPVMYPVSMHEFLLHLMRKFELCFRFPEPRDEMYLIPQLLGKDQPPLSDEFNAGSCLNFKYTYPVWPEGLIPRFIVRTHALSVKKPRWRTGVVLAFDGNEAVVKGDPEERSVFISVSGPGEGRRRLLAIIRSDFERIHADLSKLNPVASVPLPGDPSAAIPYNELLLYETKGLPSIHRVVAGDVVALDVRSLLNSIELRASRTDRATIFISYSHKDDQLRAELQAHLQILQRTGAVETWTDRRIAPGADWRHEIDRNLESADVILLLVSADFVASDYCYDIEFKKAMERHSARNAEVIPVIVRDCLWQQAPFGRLKAIPDNGRPVTQWGDRDEAWHNVVKRLQEVIGLRRSSG